MIRAMVVAFACIASDPFDPVPRRHCDVIEFNTRYEICSGRLRPVYSQLIAWRWNTEPVYDSRGRWTGTVDRVRSHGFALVGRRFPGDTTIDGPFREPGGVWVVDCDRWSIVATSFRETHTMTDPEWIDRRASPSVDRESLFNVEPRPRTITREIGNDGND